MIRKKLKTSLRNSGVDDIPKIYRFGEITVSTRQDGRR